LPEGIRQWLRKYLARGFINNLINKQKAAKAKRAEKFSFPPPQLEKHFSHFPDRFTIDPLPGPAATTALENFSLIYFIVVWTKSYK
jgi:hypothetical protein